MERLGACAVKNLINPRKQGADHVFFGGEGAALLISELTLT